MVSRREFSELTRVQIPAALHLMRLGYTYLPHNGKEIMGRDPETNILISILILLSSLSTSKSVA